MKRKGKEGFTLLETIVTLFLLCIIMIFFATMQMRFLQNIDEYRHVTKGRLLLGMAQDEVIKAYADDLHISEEERNLIISPSTYASDEEIGNLHEIQVYGKGKVIVNHGRIEIHDAEVVKDDMTNIEFIYANIDDEYIVVIPNGKIYRDSSPILFI